jgi:fructokinase
MSFKIVAIGELLWDLLPAGRQLGGAPANFASHARALSADAWLISRIGEDDLGREAMRRVERRGLRLDALEVDPALPTGTVTVELDADGQPRYCIHESVAWDALEGSSAAEDAVSEVDAVCFGTLAQRNEPSRSTIRRLVRATNRSALRILDINLRQEYYSRDILHESLLLANVLKLNETELPILAQTLELQGNERSVIEQLVSRYNLRLLTCTRGERGSILAANGQWSEHEGRAAKVADTVGAGDAFTAAMTLGFLAGWDLEEINARANEIAAFVCSQPGATPELPEALARPFRPV